MSVCVGCGWIKENGGKLRRGVCWLVLASGYKLEVLGKEEQQIGHGQHLWGHFRGC